MKSKEKPFIYNEILFKYVRRTYSTHTSFKYKTQVSTSQKMFTLFIYILFHLLIYFTLYLLFFLIRSKILKEKMDQDVKSVLNAIPLSKYFYKEKKEKTKHDVCKTIKTTHRQHT